MAPSIDTLWFCELFWHSGGKSWAWGCCHCPQQPKISSGLTLGEECQNGEQRWQGNVCMCLCYGEHDCRFLAPVCKRLMDAHPHPWNKDEMCFLGRTMLQYLLRREADKRNGFVLSLQCTMLLCLGERYRKQAVQHRALRGEITS